MLGRCLLTSGCSRQFRDRFDQTWAGIEPIAVHAPDRLDKYRTGLDPPMWYFGREDYCNTQHERIAQLYGNAAPRVLSQRGRGLDAGRVRQATARSLPALGFCCGNVQREPPVVGDALCHRRCMVGGHAGLGVLPLRALLLRGGAISHAALVEPGLTSAPTGPDLARLVPIPTGTGPIRPGLGRRPTASDERRLRAQRAPSPCPDMCRRPRPHPPCVACLECGPSSAASREGRVEGRGEGRRRGRARAPAAATGAREQGAPRRGRRALYGDVRGGCDGLPGRAGAALEEEVAPGLLPAGSEGWRLPGEHQRHEGEEISMRRRRAETGVGAGRS